MVGVITLVRIRFLEKYSSIDCFETKHNDKWPILQSLPAIFCQLYEHLSQNLGSDGHFEVLSSVVDAPFFVSQNVTAI